MTREERREHEAEVEAIQDLLELGLISAADAEFLHPDSETDLLDLEDRLKRLKNLQVMCVVERWKSAGKDHGDTEAEAG
jgi:hypothetical protein